MKPKTRLENFLAKIAGSADAKELKPKTRIENFLNDIAEKVTDIYSSQGDGGSGSGVSEDRVREIVNEAIGGNNDNDSILLPVDIDYFIDHMEIGKSESMSEFGQNESLYTQFLDGISLNDAQSRGIDVRLSVVEPPDTNLISDIVHLDNVVSEGGVSLYSADVNSLPFYIDDYQVVVVGAIIHIYSFDEDLDISDLPDIPPEYVGKALYSVAIFEEQVLDPYLKPMYLLEFKENDTHNFIQLETHLRSYLDNGDQLRAAPVKWRDYSSSQEDVFIPIPGSGQNDTYGNQDIYLSLSGSRGSNWYFFNNISCDVFKSIYTKVALATLDIKVDTDEFWPFEDGQLYLMWGEVVDEDTIAGVVDVNPTTGRIYAATYGKPYIVGIPKETVYN